MRDRISRVVNYLLEEHRQLRPADYLKAQTLSLCITVVILATARLILGVELGWYGIIAAPVVHNLVSFNLLVKGYKVLKNRPTRSDKR